MASDDVVILNQGLEMRSTKAGKTRFTIRVVSEPLVINTDPTFAAMKPAVAFAQYLKQKILGITEPAPPATQKYRLAALKAFTLGKPWAVARYSGGRTGSKPPARTMNAMNDSERMAQGISVTQGKEGGSFRVNVPANRLSEETSGGFERIWNKLVRLVPELGQPLTVGVVQEGITWTIQNMTKKMNASSSKVSIGVARSLFEVAKGIGELIDTVGGMA